MTCPSCNSPLEPNARFCGVCGYKVAPNRPPPSASSGPPGADRGARGPAAHSRSRRPSQGQQATGGRGETRRASNHSGRRRRAAASAPPAKSRNKAADDIYLGHVLNNRFKVNPRSARRVRRGVSRRPARDRPQGCAQAPAPRDDQGRQPRGAVPPRGMVLCNLRDAHTITTTTSTRPRRHAVHRDGAARGKSLHQLFHEEAPLEWRRVFKIPQENVQLAGEPHPGLVHAISRRRTSISSTRSAPGVLKILDSHPKMRHRRVAWTTIHRSRTRPDSQTGLRPSRQHRRPQRRLALGVSPTR